MSDTATVNGVTVERGDTVRAVVEGVVTDIDYDELYLKTEKNRTHWVGDAFQVTVTKKAGPKEPTEFNAVVSAWLYDEWRFVRRGKDQWYHVNPGGEGNNLGKKYTWQDLVDKFGNTIRVLSRDNKPKLPASHAIRDLTKTQNYERVTTGLHASFYKAAYGSEGLNLPDGNILKKNEAIALAWDILKAYDQVS